MVLGCLPTLKTLAKTKSSKKRKELLSKAKNCLFYAISEIARNLIKGNIPLSCSRKRKLQKFKKDIREMAKKTTTLKRRKAIINQRGGFLPGLLIPAITFLANIAADKLLK